jgi:hypothetical protein
MQGGPWMFRNVGTMCSGTNFQESMPDIRKVIDQLVDPGMLSERQLSMTKTFNMSKGDALEIPADLFRAGDDFVSEIPTFAFAFALLSPLTLLSLATLLTHKHSSLASDGNLQAA